eukprot:jgi/Tetstr1/426349/TSEL_016661.t1
MEAETVPILGRNVGDDGEAGCTRRGLRRAIRLAAPGRLPLSGLSRDKSIWVTDEVFNTASHFAALMLSLLGGAVMVSTAAAHPYAGVAWKVVGISLYVTTLACMFLASTLHHGIEGSPELETRFQALDYAAIYPLIAGTFSPMCLTFLHESATGWAFFGALWALAAIGSTATLLAFEHLPKYIPFTMYITMGWMGALFTPLVFSFIGIPGIALLGAGGVLYTVGGVIFTAEKPNPAPGVFGFHEIWHLFVMGGAACHFALVYLYVLPFGTS